MLGPLGRGPWAQGKKGEAVHGGSLSKSIQPERRDARDTSNFAGGGPPYFEKP